MIKCYVNLKMKIYSHIGAKKTRNDTTLPAQNCGKIKQIIRD